MARRAAAVPILSALMARPRLVWAFLLGLAAFPLLKWGLGLDCVPAGLLAWDAVCLSFMLLIGQLILRCSSPEAIRATASTQDEGQGVILAIAIAAGLASITAVGVELAGLKHQIGLEKWLWVALAFGTAALSWGFVQILFALHYAHEYYGPQATARCPDGYGLEFKGNEPPDYWDFLHFAIVIGVACQTADVAFTSKGLRRIGGVHGVLSFLFNTGVVALAVSLLVGLFGAG